MKKLNTYNAGDIGIVTLTFPQNNKYTRKFRAAFTKFISTYLLEDRILLDHVDFTGSKSYTILLSISDLEYLKEIIELKK